MPSQEGGSGADNKKGYNGTLIRYKQTSLLIAHVLIRQMSTVDINTRCWHAVSWCRSWASSVLKGETRGTEGGGDLTGSRLCFLFVSHLEPLWMVGSGERCAGRKALSWWRQLGGGFYSLGVPSAQPPFFKRPERYPPAVLPGPYNGRLKSPPWE